MRSAIIDIGYNAIRAVVYERDTLGSAEIFNDKFRSDIRTLLEQEELDIKHQTYLTIKYLLHIFKQLSVTKIICVATAVLRGHPRSPEFQKIIEQKFNFKIDVISGDREAYLTAAGLISGISDASGVAADLGGGSLELVEINNKTIGRLKSLPLGTKMISERNLADLATITNIIRDEFDQTHYENLYLIGGALRFIGRYYMDFVHHPLRNLHNLEISRVDFEIYLEKLDRIYKLKSSFDERNIDYNALLVAKAMLEVFSPKKIFISNYGLKEGVRFISLTPEEQAKDMVYERIKELVHINEDICKLSEYNEVINKLLINPDSITTKIVELAIMLAQFNKYIDKTLRASFVVEFILASDIPFNYRQRVMLSLILAFTYNPKSDMNINKMAKKMLSKKDYCNSQIIGNFIRIAREIDGPEFHTPSFSLILKGRYIEIDSADIMPRPVFEKVCDRLKDIAFARKIGSYE